MRRLACLLLVVALVGCASMSRMMTYPHGLADAKVTVGHREFSIWFHTTDSTILIQRGFGGSMGHALGQGLSLGAVNMMEPQPIWRAAAEAVLGPIGCRITDIYTLDNDITWEAHYSCEGPTPVPQAIVQSHRDSWRAGLAVPDPMAPNPAPVVAPAR